MLHFCTFDALRLQAAHLCGLRDSSSPMRKQSVAFCSAVIGHDWFADHPNPPLHLGSRPADGWCGERHNREPPSVLKHLLPTTRPPTTEGVTTANKENCRSVRVNEYCQAETLSHKRKLAVGAHLGLQPTGRSKGYFWRISSDSLSAPYSPSTIVGQPPHQVERIVMKNTPHSDTAWHKCMHRQPDDAKRKFRW